MFLHRCLVAVVAPQSFVRSIQLEFGASVVVEVPQLPIPRIVTVLTSIPELSTMGVVGLVTGVTVNRGLVLVEAPRMATVTRHHTMLAEQRVFGVPIMIKRRRVPSLFRMALLAFLSETSVVDIVLLMAGVAIGRCFVFVQCAAVAPITLGPSVIAFERVGGIAIVLKEQDFPVPFGVAACT